MRWLRSDFFQRVAVAFRAVVGSNVGRATLTICAALTLLGGVFLAQHWSSMVKDAQSRGSTLAYLLAEQTTRTFQAVDLTLGGLDAVFNAAPLPAHSQGFEALLAQRVAELRFIRALYVVDPSGHVVQSSGNGRDMIPMPAAQRYFEIFNSDPQRNFLIGQPLFSQPGMLSAIPVFRRLSSPDGRFTGMLMAAVDPQYFRDFYAAVDVRHSGTIDLYQDNGSILLASARVEPQTLMSPVTLPAPVFDADTQLGLVRSQSGTKDAQIVAYHRAEGYPLVVAVGTGLTDLKSRWWGVAAPTLATLAVTMLMAIALAVLIARRLEERRQAQSRAMIAQKLEALGQMTASVSHDFRNILLVMRATLQLIRKQGPQDRILSAAEAAIERGSGLVTQLLAFSRRHTLQVEPADINALLSGLTQVLGHAAGPGITLQIAKAENLPRCKADQTQFDAALMNLVVNARQAMPQGGTIRIATTFIPDPAGQHPGFVALSVADAGCGIPPGDLKRIFEPFFTTKAETGTGLGLSQVHNFMRQIGGEVTVSSAVGAGTTFTLQFPVVETETGQSALAARETSAHSEASRRLDETMAVSP